MSLEGYTFVAANAPAEAGESASADASPGNATSGDDGPINVMLSPSQRRFADVTYVHDLQEFGAPEIYLTEEFAPKPKDNEAAAKKFAEYSVLLRRRVEIFAKGQYRHTTADLEIQSKALQDVFRSLVPYWEDKQPQWQHNRNGNLVCEGPEDVIQIPRPYCELFFARDKIRDYIADEENDQALRDEVKILEDFIRDPRSSLPAVLENYEAVLEEGEVTAANVWTLFPPNEVLLFQQDAISECYICRSVCLIADQAMGTRHWQVTAIRVDFDGETIGLANEIFMIEYFGGKRKFRDLILTPVRFVPEWDSLKQQLLSRGQRFLDFLNHGYEAQQYDGSAWEHRCRWNSVSPRPTTQVCEFP